MFFEGNIIEGSRFNVEGLRFRVRNLRFRVRGLRFKVEGVGSGGKGSRAESGQGRRVQRYGIGVVGP